MTMGRARYLAVVSVLAAGCASGEDVEFTPSVDAAPKRDTAVSPGEDTATPPVDSGSAKDTAVDPPDTSSPADTGVGPVDTGASPADTGVGPVDSSVVDSSSLDSSTADSGAVDTSAIDTSIDDSSAVDSLVTDTAVTDTGVTDTAVTDAGGPTTLRLATGTYGVYGVTTDGWVVYGDAAKTMYAVSLAGGTPQTIGASISRVRVSNKAVFAWGAVDANGFAPMTVWTAANGAKALALKSLAPSTTASYATWVAAASADGVWAMFTDGGVGGSTDKADIKIAKTDGTSVKTVFTQYVVYDGSILTGLNDFCAPLMGWAGTRFVTSHCTPGASVTFDASSIDPTLGTATTLGTNLGAYWTANDAGTRVALVTSAGALRLLPIAGGTATAIDTGVASAQFTHDGAYVVYRTSANALKRSATTSATPSTLVSSGVATVLTGVSPSDKHLLYSSGTTAGAYNIRLASTTAAGTGTVLYSTAAGEIYGDAFTADSTHALYFQAVASDVGTLVAHPLAGGSAITLGTSAWIDLAATGGKVVWSDGYSALTGRANIRTRDMAGLTGTTVTIAASADANFFLSPAKDQVVYSLSGGTASDGVWASAIP